MKEPGWKDRIRVHLLCRHAAREQDPQRAKRLLDEAVRHSGSDGRPLLARARSEFKAGRCDPALQLLKRAEKRDSDNPACHLLQGQVLYGAREYAAAQEAFERTLQVDARNGLAKNFLAFCHLQQNRFEEFRRLLAEEKLWHRPDLVRIAWVQRKLPIWKLHREAVAQQEEKHLRARAKQEPGDSMSPRARIARARKSLAKGRAPEAYEVLLPLVEERKGDERFVLLFAEASVRARQAAKARPLLENLPGRSKSVKTPDDPYLFFLLGQCCFLLGEYATSVEYYQRGETHTTMPFYSAMFQYYEALSWLAAEDYRKAGEAIEQACRTDPLLASLIAENLTALLCRGEPLKDLIDEE